MTTAGHLRALLRIGVPLIGSNLAQFAMVMTDAIMVGWYDVVSLAALTIASSVWFVVFIVGVGFSNAVTPMVAEARALGDLQRERRIMRMGLWLSMLYGLAMLPLFVAAEPILLALGQAPAVAAEGALYLRIAGLALLPALAVMVLRAYLAALEHTGVILWSTVVAAILNVPINYLLIFGNLGFPELGVQGAAIATLVLNALVLAILVAYVRRVTPDANPFLRLWRPDFDIMGAVARLGLPIGLTALAEGGLFTASNIMVGWVGTVELAAHGIALQWASLAFIIHVALSQAATVRAGQAFGRRDGGELRRGAGIAIAASAAVALVATAIFLLMPETLILAYVVFSPDTGVQDEVLAIGVTFLALAALFQLIDAIQVMLLGILRGVQDTAVPMVIAIISYWVVGVPVSYVFGFVLGWGAPGVWLGLVVGLGCAALAFGWRFWGRPVSVPAATRT